LAVETAVPKAVLSVVLKDYLRDLQKAADSVSLMELLTAD
jgi:hypothetical protein